jgi:hypothetical protein
VTPAGRRRHAEHAERQDRILSADTLQISVAARPRCVRTATLGEVWAGHAGRGLSGRPAAGLLVPDIPLEETGDIRRIAGAAGLELVMLATPTTPEARMREIAAVSQGFVYLVSVTGVTGQRTKTESRVEGLIELLHGVTDKPVAVGFGVSGPEQARPAPAVRRVRSSERTDLGRRAEMRCEQFSPSDVHQWVGHSVQAVSSRQHCFCAPEAAHAEASAPLMPFYASTCVKKEPCLPVQLLAPAPADTCRCGPRRGSSWPGARRA